MKAKESYEVRNKMAEMHDDILKRIDDAIDNKRGIEACWLCYSCFENRISRTLNKASEKCSKRRCYDSHCSIKTKIECLNRLNNINYPLISIFDINLFKEIKKWCNRRNRLVHALLDLDIYDTIDDEFFQLAKDGRMLAKELYSQTTDFRNHYYDVRELPDFPNAVESKCKLKTKKGK